MRYAFFALALLFAAAALSAPVAAQDGGANATASVADCEASETLDVDTRLCEASYGDGTVRLVIESDVDQTVTLTDMADVSERGPVDRREADLEAGVLTTVQWSVSETDAGQAGVTIDTGRVLYSVPLRGSSNLIGGPWGPRDAQLAGAGAALSVSLVVAIMGWRRLSGRYEGVERLA